MTHTPVKSSAIASIGYDKDSKRMQVCFTSSPTVYEWPDVEAEDHAVFLGATSHGKHFARNFDRTKGKKVA